MNLIITLTSAGINSGPFNLYSNTDGYQTAFESDVPKQDLLDGYTSTLVPNSTTIVRVQSNNTLCTSYIDLTISVSTTTSTTSSTTSTSTSSTTTSSTTAPPSFYVEDFSNSTPTSNCAGAGASTYPITLYVANLPISLGDIVYSNNTPLANPFVGDGTWYSISSTKSYRINASGEVTEIDDCTPV